MEKKRIVVLGSTGSVGKQTLAVVEKYPELFEVVGLSAHSNEALLQNQIEQFKAKYYHFNGGKIIQVQTSLFDILDNTEAICCDSLLQLATVECDLVVSAISGIAGLQPVISALQKGTNVAIANKEAVVCGGDIMNEIASKTGAKILPLDSEHSALWQCLAGENIDEVKRLIVTASGGALRDKTKEEIKKMTAKDALNHPVWKMGKKVTIDSATLFNKGLEVVEASKLFKIPISKISVLKHPESLVHGLVEFQDNSIKASIASPDMRLPIEVALFHPHRAENSVKPLDLMKVATLNFDKVDSYRFPCMDIAIEAGRQGNGTMTAISTADEILVEEYLENKIGFYDISKTLEKVLKKYKNLTAKSLEEIFCIDKEVRQYLIKGKK